MADSDKNLTDLLQNPRESLDFEVKRWIDPDTNEGASKIAKCCLALRNNNGGRLLIGFTDDGQPDTDNAPPDVRACFHADKIQLIVSRYSNEPFLVEVQFGERDGRTYAFIIVPPGVKAPVAARAGMKSDDGKPLIRDHAVYVRSIESNTTVSSTEARRGDWEKLTRICFDNREADIGGFVRRHLSSLTPETLAGLLATLTGLPTKASTTDRLQGELDRGLARFQVASPRATHGTVYAETGGLLVPSERGRGRHTPLGYRESIILVDGTFPEQRATVSFRTSLLRNAPSHTGWPPWIELHDESDRPYVYEQGWEACVIDPEPRGGYHVPHLDFWRMEPQGVFYHICALDDDLAGIHGSTPGKVLDFLLQISRVAEVVSMGLSFARSLGCDERETKLAFGFRWSGLEGRRLTSWVEPMRYPLGSSTSMQDKVTATVSVPLETPPSGIHPHVDNVVRELFAIFEGTEISSRVVEEIVAKAIQLRA